MANDAPEPSHTFTEYLLEGMACPGGCVAGAGTIQPVARSAAAINKYSREAEKQNALDSDYVLDLPLLK